MYGQTEPAIPWQALEFCTIVGAKQRTPGGTAGVAVPLEEAEQATLDRLLSEYALQGASATLERQARAFLLVYREREKYSQVLEPQERDRLNQILDEPERPSHHPATRQYRRPSFRWPQPNALTIAITAVVAVLAVLGGVFHNAISDWISPPQAPPPVSRPLQPVQQHPPVLDPVQQTSRLLGPWRTIAPTDANPGTAQPAVLLLASNGATEASLRYTVPASADGWHVTDASDVITEQSVNGNHVDITAANGMTFVVGVDQPFWFEDNPGTIFRIDQTGRVFAISVAQGTAGRRPISK